MGKTLTGKISTGIFALSFLLIFIAFCTPHWLETDNTQQNPKFQNLGLWTVCFNNFQDPRFWYDYSFNECWWVFEEEHYIIFDFILPSFFVAVQFFFTICFTLHLLSLLCVLLYLGCSRDNDKFIKLLGFLGGALILAGLCGTVSVYLFGLYGDGRDWMPDWQHNEIGWSYALAVIGVIGTYACGVLYLVEARRYKGKGKRDERQLQSDYHMDVRTDIRTQKGKNVSVY
ncbi:uncharacterized protein LOC106669759 [Cimex lectularius]|uniref:Uncharacterized protein n=1 Tax=Cimex lectularius TaxID=79782 RepID=A0A8I6TGB0_CIMLE|nr:uncharacterized protein LOC106669759 [Cimex lectularius]